jgi:cytochrome c oxidase subunit 4
MQHRDESLKTCYIVYALLIVLLVLTVVAARVDFSQHGFDYLNLNIVIALVIAVLKAVLVMLFFMHVRLSSRLTWVFASTAFFFLALLLAFTVADYSARPMDRTIAPPDAPVVANFDHP